MMIREKGDWSLDSPREPWGLIWKIKTPQKAKHLLWRICRDCLPTRIRLRNHFVNCTLECPFCLQNIEDEWHLFFECEGSKEAWNVMGLAHVINPRLQLFDSMRDLIFYVCVNGSNTVARRMALLMWTLWKNRNNLVWKEYRVSATQSGFEAQHHWEEWHAVSLLGIQTLQQTHEVSTTTWQPPIHGKVKCNVDASFFNNEGACGWGWCIRGSNGQFILAGSNVLFKKLNIIEGEAMVIKEAIGGSALKDQFPRLYSLSEQKELHINEVLLMNSFQRSSMVWRRRLFQWEEDLLGQLEVLMREVTLGPHEDQWVWNLEEDGFFSVSSAYERLALDLLTVDPMSDLVASVFEKIWLSPAP
ncbi:uncharacterized protein LOC123904688 [Trifolium pratense]|uniref:uncharacterized protein LOC123904688 n=1 Tax=Trifolium pratense TaxID=57577 RepID=UPI001E69398F|nr:uncharacterized protein LOC123904688 [Trifolium pratense]